MVTCPAGFYAPSVCGSNGGYYCAWHNYSNGSYVSGTTDQEWDHNSKGEYILQANSLCLTDPANATQNGTPVVVEKCTGAKDQLWTGS